MSNLAAFGDLRSAAPRAPGWLALGWLLGAGLLGCGDPAATTRTADATPDPWWDGGAEAGDLGPSPVDAGAGDDQGIGSDQGPLDQGPAAHPDSGSSDVSPWSDADFPQDLEQPDASNPDPGPPPTFPGLAVVDPFIGTGAFGAAVGSTLPGATRPWGLVKVSPDTRSSNGSRVGALHCAGYRYEDQLIEGFSHTHLSGTGVPDAAAVLLLPATAWDPTRIVEDGYAVAYDKASEEASPGYYAVTLGDPGIRVELTAAERTALHRYTYPAERATQGIILDLGHALEGGRTSAGALRIDPAVGLVEGQTTMHGSLSGRFGGLPTYVSLQFDQPVREVTVWQDGVIRPAGELEATGDRVGAWITFEAADGEAVLLVSVGISYVSVEQARRNREAELPAPAFEEALEAAQTAWEQALSVIEVAGGTPEQQTIFYTALYHVMQMPTLFTDVDGSYRGFDGQVHLAEGFRYHTDLSLWDTYRNFHTLVTLLWPETQRDFVISLLRMYEQGGYFPRWPMGIGYTGCMIGTSADIVIADSYLRGVRDFDAFAAFTGLRKAADGPTTRAGRDGIEDCLALGWCPADRGGGAVSRTLEYAYDDFALSQLAAALELPAEAELYRERAQHYRNTWDPEQQFFRGRRADGSFPERFDPLAWTDEFVEGNAWHYRFFVPWDVPGLIELFISRNALVRQLTVFFEQAASRPRNPLPDTHYWHGNEPDLHSAYLFAEAGRPDLTQRWARWIMATLYGAGPDGLNGNDDGGTLSAWYVFSALGFYPVPATDRFVLGSPIFPRTRLRLPGGDLEIIAHGTSAEAMYVEAVTLNSQPVEQPGFRHGQITGGGVLRFVMSEEP